MLGFFFVLIHTKQVKFKSKSAVWSQKSPANTPAQILRDSSGACWVGPVGHLQGHRLEPGWRSLHLKKEGGQDSSWSGKEECDWHVFNSGWQEEAEGMN